jgi:SAM-dependent methyltransferase
LPHSPDTDWAVALFNRSVLKQAKYHRIVELLQDPTGKTSLDIGADNGVISYLLRQRGGRWYSADLDPGAVSSIKQLVGTDVYQLDGRTTPFPDASFDQVVIVDFLEHIVDDAGFVQELARIVKPGGRLLINVPHIKPYSLLNRVRNWIGLTDQWHGHLRPGYTVGDLTQLLQPHFVVERAKTYSRAFSELIDTLLNGLYEAMRRRTEGRMVSQKGTLVTRDAMEKRQKQFVLLSALYPVLWTVARMDVLLPLQSGYKLIVQARRTNPRQTEPLGREMARTP